MEIKIWDLEFIDLTLRTLATEFEDDTGLKLSITSLYRIGDNGVHGQLPLRGIDVSMKDVDIGKIVEKKINEKWAYDPDRPNMKCAIFHDVGQGIHLHLQSHPNTIRS